MGSGSSRSGRALRRLRSPHSRPAGPGEAAPEGGAGSPAAAEEAPKAAAVAAEVAADPGPGPAAPARPQPPGGGDETLRLLDQLLAESAAWGSGELAPRRTARPAPAPGAGGPVSPKPSDEDHQESSSVSDWSALPGLAGHPTPRQERCGPAAGGFQCTREQLSQDARKSLDSGLAWTICNPCPSLPFHVLGAKMAGMTLP
ncbi:cystin-1 isoform X1 [Dasypus novemcinctus]|uniref:cystin-1 isoform X1 n=1 Tax=Dasypus novemcinctus TaxID=9361 RepID=UPI00265E7CFC|nr:cystin-1 isoform X1 [Dasypus novemcinctus]